MPLPDELFEQPLRTRFAPTPSGDLHLGSVSVALVSWLLARVTGGKFVVRIDDLDAARAIPGATDGILDDLRWLGLDWDDGPGPVQTADVGNPFQSKRTDLYAQCLDELRRVARVYPCDCSRAEIARVAAAPHPGEETVYPGTCRRRAEQKDAKRASSLRLDLSGVPPLEVRDVLRGTVKQDLLKQVGDFVLRRADGLYSYQLATAVDDATMNIDLVVRGDDLLSSTPRQVHLQRLLGLRTPRYLHLPLVLGANKQRLAKRNGDTLTVRYFRGLGASSREVVALVAHGLRLTDSPAAITLEELVQRTRRLRWAPPTAPYSLGPKR
jgi:glutamyl-tRNA synthetase